MRSLIAALVLFTMVLPAFGGTYPVGEEAHTFDRHRATVGFGGGYGKISIDEAGVFSETSSTPDDFSMGMAFAFDYAYRLNPNVAIGGFATAWMGALDGDLGNEDWIVSTFGGSFWFRPAGEGFYLKGGFGACTVLATIDDPKSEEPLEDYSDYGFGAVGAVGYDITISPNFAAGPRLEFQAMDVGGGVTAVSSTLLFTFTF